MGLVLFYQNVTGRFESWPYAWGLIVTAVGIGLALAGRLQANPKLQHDGQRLATIGLVLFVAFGALFELLIFRSFADSVVWRYLPPLLLFARRGQGSRGEVDAPPKPQP